MDPLLTAVDLYKVQGNRVLLDSVGFTLHEGDRVALLGLNGVGKSTLLRIVAGEERPDAGEVRRRRGLTVAHLAQEPRLPPAATVHDALLAGQATHTALRQRVSALEARIPGLAGAEAERAMHELAELHEHLERLGGWDLTHARAALHDALDLPDLDAPVSALSGGERRRVALAATLLAGADLLVLDEPTNHLDTQAVAWLEGWLRARARALLLVTHDRYFLDRVATRILELDRGHLHPGEGNYTAWLEAQAERLRLEARAEEKRAAFVRRELEWIRRGPSAQRKKDRARIDRFEAAVAAKPEAGMLRPGSMEFRLPRGPRLGRTVLELRKVGRKAGERWLFRDLDLALVPGERLGILGANGAGKTTLVRVMTGELTPDRGQVVIGANTRFAIVDQARAGLREDLTVAQEVAGGNDVVELEHGPVHVRTFLRTLLFEDSQADTPVGKLSGGERNRVALAKLLRRGGNVVVLDEPTNDLDLPTLSVLEDALMDFPGCAILVSHDRWFLDKVATAVLVFQGDGRVVRYEGGASEALRRLPPRRPEPYPPPPPVPTVATPRARKLSWKEKQELEGMEAAITAAEARLEDLERRLADPATYRAGLDLRALAGERDAAHAEVERLYARWAELDAR